MTKETTYEYWPQRSEKNRPAKLRSTQEQIANVAQGVLDGQLRLDQMSPELQEVITRFIQQQKNL